MRQVLSNMLIFLGWALFAVALVCPALRNCRGEDLSGAQCLLVSLCVFPFWICVPIALSGVTNFLLLISVPLHIWEGGLERQTYGLFLLLGAVATLLGAYPLVTERAVIGCYLWIGSLFVTPVGLLIATDEQSRVVPLTKLHPRLNSALTHRGRHPRPAR